MNNQERAETYQAYTEHAGGLASYYNGLGPRAGDIERAMALSGRANPKVVELGCASGREAAIVLHYTSDYTGIDISPHFIEMARSSGLGGRFEVADMRHFEFPAGTDIVLAFASLIHLSRAELRVLLARAHAALTPGGIVYLSLTQGPYHKFSREDLWGRRWQYTYQPEDIEALAGPGFERLWSDTQTRDADWFTLVLRKVENGIDS